jgi:hypothetical protein
MSNLQLMTLDVTMASAFGVFFTASVLSCILMLYLQQKLQQMMERITKPASSQ